MAHSATGGILAPMPRISRRAMPVATVELARFLVGKRLVHLGDAGRLSGRIVETEAYSPGDPTGYARPGLTTSNAPLFAERGTAYVRMVYGTCLTLNLAAEPAGVGAAVLIRALEPLEESNTWSAIARIRGSSTWRAVPAACARRWAWA